MSMFSRLLRAIKAFSYNPRKMEQALIAKQYYLRVMPGEKWILYAYKDAGRYRVRLAELVSEEPDFKIELIKAVTQQIPFWESETSRANLYEIIKKHVPGVTDERLDEITQEFLNAAHEIMDFDAKKTKKRRKDEGADIVLDALEEEISLTDDERKKAEELLKSPDLINKIGGILDFVLVGEYKLKLLTTCCGVLAPLKQSAGVIIVDPSAIGKSTLLGRIIKLFPHNIIEEPTSFSAKSLNYLAQNFEGRILRVDEIYGAEEGMADLRVWMSEGRLERWIALGEEEGIELKKLIVEGAPVFLTSTTQTLVDEQLLTRNWLTHMDASKAQTEAIHQHQAKEFMFPEGFFEEEIKQIKTLKAALRYLFVNAVPVLIPFANRIKFPADDVRARRDYPRFLQLIAAVALIHLLQRPRIKAKDGREYILATPEDFKIALDIAYPFLETTIRGLDKTALEIYNRIISLYKENEEFTTPTLAPKLKGLRQKVSSKTVKSKLDVLEERGLLIADKSKKAHIYKLAPADMEKPAPSVSLNPFSEKEALEWLLLVSGNGKQEGTPHTHVAKTIACVSPPHPLPISESPSGRDNGANSAKEGQKYGKRPDFHISEPESPKEPTIEEIIEEPKGKTACAKCGAMDQGIEYSTDGTPLCPKCAREFKGNL